MVEHEFGEDIEGLAAKAMRPPMRLSAEDLVASELASAVLSEPLSKIRHVCEALMLLDEDERVQADITGGEAEETRRIYGLAIAIQNAHINRELDRLTNIVIDRYAIIPWPFPLAQADSWLGWVGDDFTPMQFSHGDEEYTKRVKEKFKTLSHHERVYFTTAECEMTMDTYKGIVIRFIDYAMPRAAVLMKKIIKLVSPDSYREALKIMRGAKRAKA